MTNQANLRDRELCRFAQLLEQRQVCKSYPFNLCSLTMMSIR